MIVVDLLDSDGSGYRDRFHDLVRRIPIEYKNDPLVANYVGLEDSLSQFLSFTLLVKNENIVAFSGLQTAPFPEGTARALSRTFYTHEIRAGSLSGQTLPGPATTNMLPRQLEVAGRHGVKHVFISMQGDAVRGAYFKKVFDTVNKHKTYPWDWTILEGRYNVCRKLPDGRLNQAESCWQHIAYLDRGGLHEFELIKENHDF